MKTLKYICMLACAAFITSCSLKEESISVTNPDDYFRTYSECQSVLNGCYMPMNDFSNANFFVVTEGQSDLVYLGGSNMQDAYLEISGNTFGFVACGSAIYSIINQEAFDQIIFKNNNFVFSNEQSIYMNDKYISLKEFNER